MAWYQHGKLMLSHWTVFDLITSQYEANKLHYICLKRLENVVEVQNDTESTSVCSRPKCKWRNLQFSFNLPWLLWEYERMSEYSEKQNAHKHKGNTQTPHRWDWEKQYSNSLIWFLHIGDQSYPNQLWQIACQSRICSKRWEKVFSTYSLVVPYRPALKK